MKRFKLYVLTACNFFDNAFFIDFEVEAVGDAFAAYGRAWEDHADGHFEFHGVEFAMGMADQIDRNLALRAGEALSAFGLNDGGQILPRLGRGGAGR